MGSVVGILGAILPMAALFIFLNRAKLRRTGEVVRNLRKGGATTVTQEVNLDALSPAQRLVLERMASGQPQEQAPAADR
jgi:hypothetical protein